MTISVILVSSACAAHIDYIIVTFHERQGTFQFQWLSQWNAIEFSCFNTINLVCLILNVNDGFGLSCTTHHWLLWTHNLNFSFQAKSCCVQVLAATAPSQTCRNSWNMWGIITNPTYIFSEFFFVRSPHVIISPLHPSAKGTSECEWICFSLQVWELSH